MMSEEEIKEIANNIVEDIDIIHIALNTLDGYMSDIKHTEEDENAILDIVKEELQGQVDAL